MYVILDMFIARNIFVGQKKKPFAAESCEKNLFT